MDYAKQEAKVEGIQLGIRLTAQKMKKNGMEIELIANITGLSIAEIELL